MGHISVTSHCMQNYKRNKGEADLRGAGGAGPAKKRQSKSKSKSISRRLLPPHFLYWLNELAS